MRKKVVNLLVVIYLCDIFLNLLPNITFVIVYHISFDIRNMYNEFINIVFCCQISKFIIIIIIIFIVFYPFGCQVSKFVIRT